MLQNVFFTLNELKFDIWTEFNISKCFQVKQTNLLHYYVQIHIQPFL